MRFFVDQDFDRWRVEQAVIFHIPTGHAEQMMARGGETREVGHLRAGHEAHAPLCWKAEQTLDPAGDDGLDHSGDWRHHVHLRVLVPRGHEPVSRRCRRQAAAGDEAKISGALRSDAAVLRSIGKSVEYRERIHTGVRQLTAKERVKVDGRQRCADMPILDLFQILVRVRECARAKTLEIRHHGT